MFDNPVTLTASSLDPDFKDEDNEGKKSYITWLKDSRIQGAETELYTRFSFINQVLFYTMQGLHFKFVEIKTFGNKSRQVTFFKSLFYLGAYNGLGLPRWLSDKQPALPIQETQEMWV